MWVVDGILDWMDGALKQQTHDLIGDDLKRFMEGSNNFSRSDFSSSEILKLTSGFAQKINCLVRKNVHFCEASAIG